MALRLAGPLVHHVGDERRQPLLRGRIGAGAALDQEHEGDHRHAGVLHRPNLEPVGQHVALDAGKREGRRRTERGQPRSIDRLTRHQDTATGTEPGNASLARPRGTALSTTRRSGRRYRRAASRTLSRVASR